MKYLYTIIYDASLCIKIISQNYLTVLKISINKTLGTRETQTIITVRKVRKKKVMVPLENSFIAHTNNYKNFNGLRPMKPSTEKGSVI